MDDFATRLRQVRANHDARRPGAVLKDTTRSTKDRGRAAPAKSRTLFALLRDWVDADGTSDATTAVLATSSLSLASELSTSSILEPPEPTTEISPFAPRPGSLPLLLRHTIGAPLKGTPRSPADSASNSSIPTTPFSCVVLDLETTGLSPEFHEILEVGCVELRWNPAQERRGGESPVLDGAWTRGSRVFHRYVCPTCPRSMTAETTAVHGIRWDDVRHCDSWAVVADDLVTYFHDVVQRDHAGDAVDTPPQRRVARGMRTARLPPLVAHNAGFDARFLEKHLRRCRYHVVWDAAYPQTCTQKWSRMAYPHVTTSLDAISSFLHVNGAAERAGGPHGALVDAALTARLFLQLCRRWEEAYGEARF